MRRSSFLQLLITIMMITSLSLSACSATQTAAPATGSSETGQSQSSQSQTNSNQALLVQDWAGYEKEEFWQPFIDQHPDTRVEYSFVADDAESFAKAQNSSDVDVMHPCANYFNLFVEKGLVQPIDTSRLKYWDTVYPELAKIGQIDGKQYFIPWDWGFEAILVRTDKVQNVPEAWADLWNPEYKGHLSIIDAGENAFIETGLAMGIDPYTANEEQINQIKQKLIDLKPNLISYWSDPTEASNLMANGDIWVLGNAWNENYASLSREGVAVKYVMPKEKAIGWMCGYSISSKTKNLDLVYDFLNARMDPQSLANMANDQAYGPASKEAVALMDPETVKLLNLDNPEVLDNIFFMRPLSEAQHQHFTDLWTEIKAAP
ncbi:MAG: extracellular solute-binding protein [Anaerolineae bacterium]|nr:extracellular solute-binding protein [Anaerolineae bacterium]